MSASADGVFDGLVRDHRVIACVGPGGVGKTTLSAAIALGAARRGRRVTVLTIDPARRLADALGAGAIGNEATEIPRERLDALGVPPEGALAAVMLDPSRTFDALVERFASDATTRDRILANPIYRHVSGSLAGSAEYTAVEKLYELHAAGDRDLIVLDTPPSAHALDFLEAPNRLIGLFDSRIVQLLVRPAFQAGRLGMRWFQWGTHQVLKLIERISGWGFVEDLSEFLLAIESLSDGFRERAAASRALLFGDETAFVVATGPTPEAIRHALQLETRLHEEGVRTRAFVANRVRQWPDDAAPIEIDASELAAALAGDGLAPAQAAVAATAAVHAGRRYASAVAGDAESLDAIARVARTRGARVRLVPELRSDVHDLEALASVEARLFEREPAVVPPIEAARR